MKRRHVLAALFAATVASGAAAQKAPAPQRYAVLSAVGDQMTVVRARTQTGSRLDRNDHEVAALPDRALDRLVLKHVDGTLKRAVPTAEVAALAVASGRLLDVQRQALARNRPSDAMARAFAEVLPTGGADRLLLVIKHRAEAGIPVVGGNIGLGRLEGSAGGTCSRWAGSGDSAPRRPPACGRAPTSRGPGSRRADWRIEGCRGVLNSVRRVASSTMRPRYMTPTRSEM